MSAALQRLPDEAFARLVRLHTQLSPENLCGDGEVPESVWREREVELHGALIALQAKHDLSNDDIGEAAVFVEYDHRNALVRPGQRARMRP